MKFETTFPTNPFGLSDQEKQILKSLNDEVLKKIGLAAALIEDNLDDDALFEIECKQIAELTLIREERVRTQLRALRISERAQRQQATRTKKRFLWCVLVFFCQVDPLKAGWIVSLIDEPIDGGGGCGLGMRMV